MKSRSVHLFVFDTLADWEPSYAIAGLNNPAFPTRGAGYHVKTVGMSRKPIVTMGGVSILPDMTLDELLPTESAMLILPGGDQWDMGALAEVIPYIELFLLFGAPIAASCGATDGLARAGLLDTVRHTSNALEYLLASGYHGAALYQHERAVTDQNVITAGATGSLEFAAHIFRRLALYPDDVLDAWYDLLKTGDAVHFGRLQALAATYTAA